MKYIKKYVRKNIGRISRERVYYAYMNASQINRPRVDRPDIAQCHRDKASADTPKGDIRYATDG